MDKEYGIGICAEHPFYTVEEIFAHSGKTVRGFVEKNYSKKMHSQAFYEINIVLRGKATHYIEKGSMAVEQGDVFIIPPNIMHGYDGGEGFDVYHILVSPKFLEKYSASLQLLNSFASLFKIDPLMRARASAKLHFRLTQKDLDSISSRFKTLTVRSYEQGSVDTLVSEGEVLIIISELCDIYDRTVRSLSATESEDSLFIASISHIYRHYNEKITVDILAGIAHMSRTSYIEKFKRVLGCPPARFIRCHKVEMITQMLTDTSMSEAEIACAVGCSDVSHLIKIFTADRGVSPSKYRKNLIK